MARVLVPRDYQVIGMNHLLEHPRCALWAGMGMGKGVITLNALNTLALVDNVFPILVLGPLRVARSVWSNEVFKWEHLNGMKVSTITGTVLERRAAIGAKAEIYTCNYENVPWLVKELDGKWPFVTVIADESTRLKGFRFRQGGERAKALASVAHTKVKRFIELTGTPSPNGLKDLYGQVYFLDAGVRLGRTYEGFMQRWFQAVPGGDGYSQVRPLSFAQDEIQDRIRDICLTLDPKDYFDLKDPIVTPVYVNLPSAAMTQYKRMEKEMFAQIEEHGIEAFNAGAKTMKCRQLANGAAYVDDSVGEDRPWVVVHDEKLEALDSIIEEANGAPVIVAYQFRSDLARLKMRFPKGRVLKTKKDEDDFKAGKIQVLFCHPASAAHGIDGFQNVCNTICFFADDWNLELYEQILERIGPVRQIQSGLDRAVYVYLIIALGTIDEDLLARRETKASVQDVLKLAMKRRIK